MLNDDDYVNLVLKGNPKEYRYFVKKYKDLVFAITYRVVKNYQDAEELTQDTFIKAYQNLNTFNNKAKFSTWLYKIAFHIALNRKRQSKPNTTSYDGIQVLQFADWSQSALQNLKTEQQKEYINLALNSLPEEDSVLLTLYYLAENRISEITQIMDLSESNVKVKLHRARKNLSLALQHILKEEAKTLY